MFESLLLQEERNAHFFKLFFIGLVLTLLLGIVNSFIGKNALFLVALVSLALAYPIVNYVREMDEEELKKKMSHSSLIRRHEKELVVFWAIVLGVTIGFFLLGYAGFITDFYYQELFVKGLSGNIIDSIGFLSILKNNLLVAFFTFVLSIIAFSGLIFVLTWNASIVSYYLLSIERNSAFMIGLMLLPHGLLEIGGYVFAGIAGSILAYRFDQRKKFNQALSKEFVKDLSVLLIGSILLLILAAGVEVL